MNNPINNIADNNIAGNIADNIAGNNIAGNNIPDNLVPMGELPYISDNNFVPWMNNICSAMHIENLNSNLNVNIESVGMPKEIDNIITIHRELTKLSDEFDEKEIKPDDEMKKKIDAMKEKITTIDSMIKEFHEQIKITKNIEKEYKESYENTVKDIDKVSDFKNFVIQMNQKYKDFEINKVNESILEITEKIKKDNKSKTLKEEYLKQNYLLNFYIQNFIKRFNGSNIGSTCSLCLQRQVDTFLDPCGHTACSECVRVLKETDGEYNCNCFLCRKKILQFKRLYFV